MVVGVFLILFGALRTIEWCFYTAFMLMGVGTFIAGLGAVLVWRIHRVFGIVATLTAVLIMAAFLFSGFC